MLQVGYNISGFSATPEEMAPSIKKYIPEFEICYQPDFCQEIADSREDSADNLYVRSCDHWSSKYDLEQTTSIILKELLKLEYTRVSNH